METNLFVSIPKEAGLGSAIKNVWGSAPVRLTRGVTGKGLTALFGGMMGAEALRHIGEIREKGPVGVEGEEAYKRDIARTHEGATNPEIRGAAQRAVGNTGLLGGLLGGAATLPWAFKTGRPSNLLMPIGGAIIGRSLGRWIGEKRNPEAAPKSSLMDATVGRYYSLMDPEQRKALIDIRNSDEVMNNPLLQQQIARAVEQKMGEHPAAKKWKKTHKTYGTIGKVLGAGALLAAMIWGKKKGLHGLNKGIMARPGGFMSGDPMKAYVGLGLAGAGTHALSAYLGSGRAGLSKKERGKVVKERLLSPETGMELAWAGNYLGKGL